MHNYSSCFQIKIVNFESTNFLGLLGGAPAGTALFATGLRTALGRTPGRLPLATLLGNRTYLAAHRAPRDTLRVVGLISVVHLIGNAVRPKLDAKVCAAVGTRASV